MEIRVIAGEVTQVKVPGLIVNLFEGVEKPGGATAAVDEALGGAISQLMKQGEIKGKLREVTLIHTLGKVGPERVFVVGLGKLPDFTLDRVRIAVAEACRVVRRAGVEQVATIGHGAGVAGFGAEEAAQAVAEGALLGLYQFRRHLTKPADWPGVKELLLVEKEAEKLPLLERGVARGQIIAEATNFARDLVNEPANVITPTALAEAARQVAAEFGLEITILDREQVRELGMGALLGVAQGSHQPPKFIILRYLGAGADSKKSTLGFIGKAITFDSGGISLKPSEGMWEMKTDKAGGVAVIAALRAISQLKPRLNVIGLIPATENLPGGGAQKPGDVVRALNGKTIEVENTDAEGRLILADALSYARKQGLSPLVDVATLTGACRVALGDICSGAFTNNQDFLNKVLWAGERAGERHWAMPMFEEYKEQNKSDTADIKNTGGRWAGAITAAQFLAEFAETTPWVHLDIAGTAFTDKEKGYLPKGATGVPVRTLINLALDMAQE